METHIIQASPSDRGKLRALLDSYLGELAKHRELPVGANDANDYPHLEGYFSEPGRYPFLIEHKGVVVGFALIRSPESTGTGWQVAEFYVEPGSRRLGVGREAIELVWRSFPGEWELQIHAGNMDSVQFWMTCVNAVSDESVKVTEIQAPDGRRLQLNFRLRSGRAG